MDTQTVIAEQHIKVPASQVYLAFTNATALKEWLCDVATVLPRPGGRMYLWWNGDFYSSGEYINLETDLSISFKWHARFDPSPTQVDVKLAEKDGGTWITIAHTVPEGDEWQARAIGFQNEWAVSLKNLASVLETGLDLRIFDRPMLGIFPGDFTTEQAAKLGVPVTAGVRLDGVAEGMGAQAAGLISNDVLVSLAGKPLTDFESLRAALQGKKGGDRLEVIFYRGLEKKNVTMELSRRPVPDIPFDIAKLALGVRARYDESLAMLKKAFEGVTEAEASFHSNPKEWSAKEVLGHLILGEQIFANFHLATLQGQELWSDSWTGNSNELTRATLAAYPTVPELLDELHRLANMTVAFIESWPSEFVARKGGYFRVAWQLLEGQTHTQAHLAQIADAIAAARKG